MIAAIESLQGIPILEGLTASGIAWGATLMVSTTVVSALAVAAVLVLLPANYLADECQRRQDRLRRPNWWWLVLIAKNLLGILLVVIGVVMLVAPGQGLLTILLGILLMDLPGKHHLVRKLVAWPTVLPAINRLRARFDKPPMTS
jgi:amino acid transporter